MRFVFHISDPNGMGCQCSEMGVFEVAPRFVTRQALPDLFYVEMKMLGRELRTVSPRSFGFYGTVPTNELHFCYNFAEWDDTDTRFKPVPLIYLTEFDFPLSLTLTFWVRRTVAMSSGIIPGMGTPLEFTIASPYGEGRPINAIQVEYNRAIQVKTQTQFPC